ncbi:MAG: hypothetical protein ACFFDH_03405 [Promethearchaeota archaeon]
MEKLDHKTEDELLKLYKENKQKIIDFLDKKQELKKELAHKGD